jgi:arylsulfatase A-like enzyme
MSNRGVTGMDPLTKAEVAQSFLLGRAARSAQEFPRQLASRRLMEVAAGFAEHVDVQVGRVVDEIDSLGYGDNTLIFYIWGDNGSSAEGQDGTVSELLAQNSIPSTIKQHIAAFEDIGGLDALGSGRSAPA